MTREEEIENISFEYGKCISHNTFRSQIACYDFKQGAIWADEHPKSPWISVKEDLPCKHNDLLVKNGLMTKRVIVVEDNHIGFDRMAFRDNIWDWINSICPSHWALIPEPPKE